MRPVWRGRGADGGLADGSVDTQSICGQFPPWAPTFGRFHHDRVTGRSTGYTTPHPRPLRPTRRPSRDQLAPGGHCQT